MGNSANTDPQLGVLEAEHFVFLSTDLLYRAQQSLQRYDHVSDCTDYSLGCDILHPSFATL